VIIQQSLKQLLVGIDDERMGEVAKAFVVLKPNQDLDTASLLEWSKENMANYKVPRAGRVCERIAYKCSRKSNEIST
jgi:acyl-CoA synthetase (AMP-forming)/AMP-acid ligase II